MAMAENRTYGGYSSRNSDSIELQAAANYIASRHYAEALHVLSSIVFAERGARWYYYSAMANAGMGNNVTAKEHIDQAVALEPSNMEYRQFKQHLEILEEHGIRIWVIVMKDLMQEQEAGVLVCCF